MGMRRRRAKPESTEKRLPIRGASARRRTERGERREDGNRPPKGEAEVPKVPGTQVDLCRHFGTCGGCDALDVPLADQLSAKRERVRAEVGAVLDRHGHEAIEIDIDVPDRVPIGARTKLLYPAQPDAEGQLRLGLYERRSHALVPIRECRTQMNALTAVGSRIATTLRELGLTPYDETKDTGFVRALHARIAPGTGELLVGLVTRGGEFEKAAEFAAAVAAACEKLPRSGRHKPELVGVMRSIGTKQGNYLLGEKHMPLRGRDYLVDRQAGLTFRIGFSSFYQVHRNADAVLYRPALAMAGDVTGQRVVDGYGGIGTFGLRFARAGAAQVEVVEDHPSACADARENITRNKLGQVTVVESGFAAAEFAPEPDLLVVDPPRKGLEAEGVARVLAARPGRILHVACSLSALCRDLDGLLAGKAYQVTALRVCDLFPHSEHAEIVARLDRR